MPLVNRIAAFADEMKTWRRWLHRHPELSFDLPLTSAYVVERLRAIGVDELHEGIARSGIVAVIRGRGEGPAIGLRADMDALPITETTGAEHTSTHPGKMHACGHDGHTAMLLGAAKYLAETRNFAGTAVLIFQPAEEHGGGGEVMVKEGVLDRFQVAKIFALHNAPNVPFGHLVTTPGPIMAAVDTFEITVKGRGGHGAMPHETADPVVAAVAIVQALQTIVSRNAYALDEIVLSVTQIHTGTADNVIPETAWICGTVRTFRREVQAMVRGRMEAIVAGQAAAYGVSAALDYQVHYPATVNDPAEAEFAIAVAREVVGETAANGQGNREMGAEDFSYMLNTRPGCYLFLGQGAGPSVHHPGYDFNDEIAPIGASFFARLIERALPLG
jgi:hippurate hydrolase